MELRTARRLSEPAVEGLIEHAPDAGGNAAVRIAPPLERASMAPQSWRPRGRAVADDPNPSPEATRWHATAYVRRLSLLGLVAAQTWIATASMLDVLPYHGGNALEIVILVFFAILFFWISAGFWTAMAGFALQCLGRDRYAISGRAAGDTPLAADARTAIVMPICNEDVRRVFAGLRATYESLARTGEIDRFDFFILSDSSDPDLRVAETDGWFRLCHAVGGFGRVFYRWRRHRIKRKSGNIGDFCRRWGRRYRYMVVLDADSVMSGECLTRLVRLMEANPNAGIIQTAPRTAGRETLFARLQQYASRVYSPVFTAGLHFWQLGEAHYWGHNAIIRVEPFIRHCALARLPGRGALSGEILSHDFVEAALMRRAGWAVWIAYDLPGSYEELPSNLVEELQRDRRWCRGNLMNFRLLLAAGLHPAHRAVFFTGAMAYASAAFWFLFLILCTALLAQHALSPPTYFTEPNQLFPIWPEWHPRRAIELLTTTALLLYLPKILSVLLVLARDARAFGNGLRLTLGMLAESVFSALAAPIRMLFHTRFVASSLLGFGLHWRSPSRQDVETGWREAMRRHGWDTLLGVAWAGAVYALNPASLWWFAPVTGAMMLSIPLSVYTSRVSLGLRLRRLRLLLTPEESRPPWELRATRRYRQRAPVPPGFVEAVVNPHHNALARAAAGAPRRRSASALRRNQHLIQEMPHTDPDRLDHKHKMTVLSDPVLLARLHALVVSSAKTHPGWLEARRESSTES